MSLLSAQPHIHPGLNHGFDKEKHIGRPGARHRGHRVQQILGLNPDRLPDGLHQRLHLIAFGGCHAAAGKQAGLSQTDQCRCIWHGPHHALCAQPAANAVAAHPGGHTQVQGLSKQAGQGLGHFLENLWFDRPDHELRCPQSGARVFVAIHPQAVLQMRTGGGQRIHHMDLRRVHALFKPAGDQGLGHIAPAYQAHGHK